jgi:hypothetical protein
MTDSELHEAGRDFADESSEDIDPPTDKDRWESLKLEVQQLAKGHLKQKDPNAAKIPGRWQGFWQSLLARWWEIAEENQQDEEPENDPSDGPHEQLTLDLHAAF